MDGINQWTAIGQNTSSPRTKMVYNIDDETVPARLNIHEKRTTFQVKKNKEVRLKSKPFVIQICVRDGQYKLIWGTKYMLARHYRKLKHRGTDEKLELYNLETDPGETENISQLYPDVVEKLKYFGLQNYEEMVPPGMGLKNWVIVWM